MNIYHNPNKRLGENKCYSDTEVYKEILCYLYIFLHTPMIPLQLSHPWSCASMSHLFTWALLSEILFTPFPIINGNPASGRCNSNRRSCFYGKSYTECPSFPFYIWDIYLSSFSFLVPILQIYMYHVLLTLDSFSNISIQALVLCVDLQSEYLSTSLNVFLSHTSV